MKNVNFKLNEEQKNYLNEKKKNGMLMSYILRTALDNYIKANPLPEVVSE